MRSDTFADRVFTFARSQALLMDTLLAVVLFVLSVLPLTTDADIGFSLLLIAPLIFRRALPMFTFGLVTAVGLFQLVVFYGLLPANVSALVVIYTIAAYGERWASRLVLVAGLLGGPLGAGVFYSSEYYGGSDAFVTVTFTIAVSVVAAWALGTLRRSRLQQVDGQAEQARLREQEQQHELRLAASTERARIAREMHDVVAHSLSVVIAQADGGRYAGRESPETALKTLETIADTGRQALSDMRGLLGILRRRSGPGRGGSSKRVGRRSAVRRRAPVRSPTPSPSCWPSAPESWRCCGASEQQPGRYAGASSPKQQLRDSALQRSASASESAWPRSCRPSRVVSRPPFLWARCPSR